MSKPIHIFLIDNLDRVKRFGPVMGNNILRAVEKETQNFRENPETNLGRYRKEGWRELTPAEKKEVDAYWKAKGKLPNVFKFQHRSPEVVEDQAKIIADLQKKLAAGKKQEDKLKAQLKELDNERLAKPSDEKKEVANG